MRLDHRGDREDGDAVAAVAAVVLTVGAVNAYVTGAAAMARQLARNGRATAAERDQAGPPGLVVAIAAASAATITLYWLKLASTAALVMVPTALFLAVYLGCMLSAARVLGAAARLAAVPAALAVVIMLTFCGWSLALPAAVALEVAFIAKWRTILAATATQRMKRAQHGLVPVRQPHPMDVWCCHSNTSGSAGQAKRTSFGG